jgi:hypothetical protein
MHRIKVAADAEERSDDGDRGESAAAADERLEQHQKRAKAAPNQFGQDAKQVCGVGERGHLAGSEPFE